MLDAKVGLTEKNVKYNIKRYLKNFDAIKYWKFKKNLSYIIIKGCICIICYIRNYRTCKKAQNLLTNNVKKLNLQLYEQQSIYELVFI